MRVLMLSKALVVGIYQRKLELIAAAGVDLLALTPPAWKDERGLTPLERVYTAGYRLETAPIALNGNFHLHFYPDLLSRVRAFKPDIVHIDEEAYNLSAWQAYFAARQVGAKTLFFTWQNITRRYPPPFSWGERWLLRGADYALAGTESAAEVLRGKGYAGRLAVVPQFGVDADLFRPARTITDSPFTVGYFGRLVEEKGLTVLLQAAAQLTGEWRLRLVGSGPQAGELRALAERLGVAERVEWVEWVASQDMPAQYQQIDALVIPSLTRPNWKEQFGRVITEAFAAGVPVIGSDSGAIPDIIGMAGVIVPEGDVAALADGLRRLQTDAALRAQVGAMGRERALAHFTHAQVAADTVRVYREMLI